MERRAFIGTVAGGLLAAPLAAEAQPPAGRVYRVGFLSPLVGEDRMLGRLLQGLRDRGYVEGRNLVIEQRYAAGRREAPGGPTTPGTLGSTTPRMPSE